MTLTDKAIMARLLRRLRECGDGVHNSHDLFEAKISKHHPLGQVGRVSLMCKGCFGAVWYAGAGRDGDIIMMDDDMRGPCTQESELHRLARKAAEDIDAGEKRH